MFASSQIESLALLKVRRTRAMKIIAFAGGFLAIPSLQQLAQSGLLAGIVLPIPANEGTRQIKARFGPSNIAIFEAAAADMNAPLSGWLQQQNPDVAYVLTFNHKIPGSVLDQLPRGFFNFHFALLPQYRGPQPLFWQLKNREPFGGISVHQMTERIDEGPLAIRELLPILPEDTYGMHQIKLAYTGPKVVAQLTMALVNNALMLTPQDDRKAHYYSRPKYEDLVINWEQHDSPSVKALLNAANPWNRGAFTMINGMQLNVIAASITSLAGRKVLPGTIIDVQQPGTFVQCSDGRVMRIDITYSEEGYLTGEQLSAIGIQASSRFTLS
jgi:methionyl-tRNA formyltransferase